MENQLYFGQINYDELLETLKSGKANTQIVERKDGTKFRAVDVNIWLNAQKDQFGQDGSIQIGMKEEHRSEKHYLGNLRKFTPKPPEEAKAETFAQEEDDDLAF